MAQRAPPTTLGSELRRLFPEGTRSGAVPRWHLPPIFPADLFAVAAHLLERSGAYAYIVAPFESSDARRSEFTYQGPTKSSTQRDINRWRNVGKSWRNTPGSNHGEILTLWRKLRTFERRRLIVTPRDKRPIGWWQVAHALLIVADEASEGLGYTPPPAVMPWANDFAAFYLDFSTRRKPIGKSIDERHWSRHVALDSLALEASRDVARVLPKGRTTELGCTMRTFSHNLALIPAHGHPNVYWHQGMNEVGSTKSDDLNILLIPFPFVIRDGSFQSLNSTVVRNGAKWGRFRINQTWLTGAPASFCSFVDALIEKAGGPVNAVVLPEYALSWMMFDALVRHLRDKRPEIEFVISGISSDCNGREGNQAAFSVINRVAKTGEREAQTHSQRKHHRWFIERTQIEAYDLGRDLAPDTRWWEYLEVEERVVHIDVFRESSAFTAVICEDLARVDPGLALLRLIGPNLVFALLMDGAQLLSRWPGTYAASLADDPGSSVLTLSSMGLIARSNEVRMSKGKEESRSIGLWKNRNLDGSGSTTKELVLDSGAQGIVVRLKGEKPTETTIDNRPNTDTSAWVMEKAPTNVTLSGADIDANGWRWIFPTS